MAEDKVAQRPTIGRIVHYKLSASDVEAINRRRKDYNENPKTDWPKGAQAHVGNQVEEGQVCAMIVTAVWSETLVNGQVFLDGNDTFWVLSAEKGEANREWSWPTRA